LYEAWGLRHADEFSVAGCIMSLFLISDLILASELFRNTQFPSSGDLIWLTYWAGQALIVDSLGGTLAELTGRSCLDSYVSHFSLRL
jgi:YhhN family